MRVGYFVNQYPKVSHSFIRREILALEAQGCVVQRYALRGWDAEVADPADEHERQNTGYILQGGAPSVVVRGLLEGFSSPGKFLGTLKMAWRMNRRSDRPLAYHLFTVLEGAVLARWARKDGISHVHAHFGTNSAEVCLYAHLLSGLPYSFTVHGPDEWDHPQALHIGEKVRHACFVAAISHYTRAQVFRWVDVADQPRVQVVRCGLTDEYLDQPVPPRAAGFSVVCVGRLCAAKSQHLLVDAVAHLRREGLDVPLVLVGDGELRGVVEERIRTGSVQDLVTITGWASEAQVRQHLSAASVMAMPSLAEGLPVAIMEAMALGRPVITTYIAGIPELVEPGVNGWLCPATDLDSLVAALREAASLDEPSWQRMSAAAKQAVGERHRIVAEAAKLRQLFEQAPS